MGSHPHSHLTLVLAGSSGVLGHIPDGFPVSKSLKNYSGVAEELVPRTVNRGTSSSSLAPEGSTDIACTHWHIAPPKYKLSDLS